MMKVDFYKNNITMETSEDCSVNYKGHTGAVLQTAYGQTAV